MRKFLISYILAALTALCITANAPASEVQTWAPLDRNAAIELSRGITPDGYPDADVVIVDQHTWVSYREDGTYTEWYEEYVKVLTEKGKRRYRSLTSSFSIPYNTTKFILAEIIRADGSTREVDIQKNSREMVNQSQMYSNIYDPNDRILQVSIPELQIGEMVHYVISDEFIKARMPGTFSEYITFEGTDPIKRSCFTVVAPRTKPLKSIALKAEIPGTVTHTMVNTEDEIVYQWIAKDVPRAFEEPEMPPLYTQVQRLLVSTIPDWRTVSRWYWNLSKPHIAQTTPGMRSTVIKLVKGIQDRNRKIEAIFHWTSQKVRYLGIVTEKEAPGYEPHPVCMTYERRAGVCRDKAALLVAMLRLAGFEAYPVLIMVGPKKDPEVPQPYFNHAVVCVKNKDGSYLLMDPTNENTKELFPAYLNNQSYLVATPQGETLLTSPIIPAEQNMMRIATAGTLDGKGVLRADTTLAFEGINDNAYRGYFSMISQEERRTYFEKVLKKVIPGATLTGFTITPEDMLDVTKTLKATMSFSATDFLMHARTMTMFPSFRFGNSIGTVNHLIQRMGLKERKYAYQTDIACGVDETMNIKLDASLMSPLNLPLQDFSDDGCTSWKRSYSLKEGSCIGENLFAMKLPEYSPDQYKSVQETLKKIEKSNRIMPLFSNTPSVTETGGEPWYAAYAPDAVILDERLDVDIISETAWTETTSMKVKVITYAGKKRYGDLQIPFNPVWEDIEVKKALVTSPTGQTREISKDEINVMDQEWVGKARRYPAGKFLVMSLPSLQEGSTIEYEIVSKKRDRPSFYLETEFQEEDPIEAKTLRLHVRDGVRLKSAKADAGFGAPDAWKPFPDEVIIEEHSKEGNTDIIEFSARRIPPIRKEENLPPGYSFKPSVFVSSGSLARYADEVSTALVKASSSQPEAARKAQEIIRTLPQGEERILKIRDFVARNIQSIDISLSELPLNQISLADRTLADGYGNTADRAALLYAMCKAAGFQSEFILTSSASSIEALNGPLLEFPAHQWFNVVLVRIKTGHGYIYLGDTDQYAALGTAPASGIPALVTGSGTIETIRALSEDYENRGEDSFSIELKQNGDALIRKKRLIYGTGYGSFRKGYKEMPPEEQRRRFQEIVSSISKAAVAESPYMVSCDTYPAVEEFTVSVPSYAVRQDDRLSLFIPGIAASVAGVTGDERFNPLYRDYPTHSIMTVEVLLPEGVRSIEAMPPESVRYHMPGSGDITLETKVVSPPSDNSDHPGRTRIVVVQRMDLKPMLLMPDEYPALLDIQSSLSHPRMRTLMVRMGEGK